MIGNHNTFAQLKFHDIYLLLGCIVTIYNVLIMFSENH